MLVNHIIQMRPYKDGVKAIKWLKKSKNQPVNNEDFGGKYAYHKKRNYPENIGIDAEDIAGGITLLRR